MTPDRRYRCTDVEPALRTMQTRVKRGADLLDDRRPGWQADINLKTLRLSNCDRCVLGQLDAYGMPGGMISHGFMRQGENDYDVLQRLWVHQVKKRRAACPS